MSFIRQIFDYIKTLSPWQQDAARRLYEKPQGLSEDDYHALYFLLLKENGIVVGDDVTARAIDENIIPYDEARHSLTINSISQLCHVNCVDSKQSIEFAKSGMTIIYGENGTGKSGYARVFKRACFCRDKSEEILPNVTLPGERGCEPSAVFNITYDGSVRKITWKQGMQQCCPELAYVSVFDSKTARMALTSEQEIQFRPYGFEILEKLGSEVVPRLKAMLLSEANSLDLRETAFSKLHGDHEVGVVFADLRNADIAKVRELGNPTERHKARGLELKKILNDSNLEESIRSAEMVCSRIDAALANIMDVNSALSEENVESFHVACKNRIELEQASAIAAQKLQGSDDLLDGSGGAAWKRMFVAAQNFVAGTVRENVSVSDIGRCPLCQRTYDNVTLERVRRFEAYIANEVSVALDEANKQCDSLVNSISRLSADNCIPKTTIEELSVTYPDLEREFDTWALSVNSRKACVTNALLGKSAWIAPPVISDTISSTLRRLSSMFAKKASEMRDIMASAKRNEAEKEIDALRKRFLLKSLMPQVEEWFIRRDRFVKLIGLSKTLSTLPYTQKIKELSDASIISPLISSMKQEFHRLRLNLLPNCPVFSTKGKHGKIVETLSLQVANPQSVTRILSEGEQKIIAIAAFLGELSIAGHTHAIVFDDPMTSLDYYWRREVAARLSEESKNRQVIIFSHEPAFVNLLIDNCKQNDVTCVVHSLSRIHANSGVVSPGSKWVLKKYTERIDELEKMHAKLNREIIGSPTEDEIRRMRRVYALLRETIEQVVQDVCFLGTVKRFDNYVNVKQLLDVVPLDDVAIRELYLVYRKCSNYIEGHDHGTDVTEAPPLPHEFINDLSMVKNAIQKIKDMRNQSRANRQLTGTGANPSGKVHDDG